MSAPYWYLLIGGVFLVMAAGVTLLKRLPLTTSIVYLAIGFTLGPTVLDVAHLDFASRSKAIEHVTEVVVLLSLFSVGLKLRVPFRDDRWRAPVRLATLGMVLTIALVAAIGHLVLGLPLAAAVLLGAVLGPTDPVLASDVQVEHALDRDRVRFTLTAESGLNDGTAFPFVMLGLGLLGTHHLGPLGVRWLAVDVLWATAAGLGIGWLCGQGAGRVVLYLRRRHRESVGLDDFLALGLIALAYGLALHAHAYGFLAVFAAGLSLRQIEQSHSGDADPKALHDDLAASTSTQAVDAANINEAEHPAVDKKRSAAFMAHAALAFNTQLERIAEVLIVAVVGVLLSVAVQETQGGWPTWRPWVGAAVLILFVARPVATYLCLIGSPAGRAESGLSAWFGVRGIGSVYYLSYAASHGFTDGWMIVVERVVLVTIAMSMILHGLSVTPAMKWYERTRAATREADAPPQTPRAV